MSREVVQLYDDAPVPLDLEQMDAYKLLLTIIYILYNV